MSDNVSRSQPVPATVQELGEFGLIERITAHRSQVEAVEVGPGDDAAVLVAARERYVVTTDMLVEGRHFRLDWSSPNQIGHKAIAQSAADVLAMGAQPTGYVVALGCPGDTAVEFVDALTEGMWAEAMRSGGSIAGGDLVSSPQLVISVTAFGDVPPSGAVLRDGAQPGDVVAVAGRLGWSAAGQEALAAGRGKEVLFADVVAVHCAPAPPYYLVEDVMRGGTPPRALTDVSDGLLVELGALAAAGEVALNIDVAALGDQGLSEVAAALGADVREWISTGGEDHAFIGIFPPGNPPPGWTVIGSVAAGAGVRVVGRRAAQLRGWEAWAGLHSALPDIAR